MQIFYLVPALLLAISFHEAAHAYVAMILGDPTAKLRGRVTLNPLKHLDLLGTIMIFIVGFGWGKPVPVNPYNFKDFRKGEALTALAGPMSNFILALVSSFFVKNLSDNLPLFIFQFLQIFILLNVALMCFNLIPIPPLDGSKIMFLFLPDKYYELRPKLEKNGPMILLGIIFIGRFMNLPILSFILNPMIKGVYFLLGL